MADDSVRALRALIDDARSIGVLTGAGISTESGIPDYRSSGGIWSQMQPITYQEFVASEDARLEDWRRRFIMNEDFARAEPNAGHRGLVALDRAGKLRGLITQNIDGLHLRPDCRARQVVEIHGNATRGACLDCHRSMELSTVRTQIEKTGISPRCPACGGWVKAAVISFGQSLDPQTLEDAMGIASEADLFLAIGSSLVVEPAASLPRIAYQAGARLVVLNQEPTPLDAYANLVVHQPIGQIFSALDLA